MVRMKKPMIWKEEDGTKYKISFSEKLQMRNLEAARKQVLWHKRNFYAKLALIAIFCILTAAILFLLYRLDLVDFFSKVMYR